jgi:hypothetical protein
LTTSTLYSIINIDSREEIKKMTLVKLQEILETAPDCAKETDICLIKIHSRAIVVKQENGKTWAYDTFYEKWEDWG